MLKDVIAKKDSFGTYYKLYKRDKIPIIFIHGVGLDHQIWEYQIYSFENTILTYDILGHGKTPLKKDNISFDDFSLQLLNLVDELKIKKFHLVGFSIGSLIARNFASKYSQHLETLTLLSSIYKRSKEQQKIVNERLEKSKKSSRMPKTALFRWFNEKYLMKNTSVFLLIDTILNQNYMKSFNKVYELFVNHRDDEKLENIKTKTLIITGENDIGSTPEMSKNLNKVINNSKVKIIPIGKHLCHIECSNDVNNVIKEHING
tara:strand:+ start:3389 stop:4171 length:783 start_codon:yes stop_codon:yes gene_type:complete